MECVTLEEFIKFWDLHVPTWAGERATTPSFEGSPRRYSPEELCKRGPVAILHRLQQAGLPEPAFVMVGPCVEDAGHVLAHFVPQNPGGQSWDSNPGGLLPACATPQCNPSQL